jgi:hypothetical protein
VEKRPSKRAYYSVIAFGVLAGLLMLAGGVYSWTDEHGGIGGKARVTSCESHHITSRQADAVYCDATWTYKGRTATGYVENAKMDYEGKTIDVRIHGTSHVTVTTNWVPIGLFVFGLFIAGGSLALLRQYQRRQPAT